ncbi:phosphatase PAP2 family protein [Serratia rubidaea]
MLFLWLSRDERLDWAISNMWFDSASGHFPWQHNVWLDVINHRLLKIGVIAASVLALLWGIYRRHARLILCMLLVGVGPLVVGLLKAFSAHSCPWDLVQYGGQAMSFPLFGALPANPGPGRCFPGGHASSGFAVMALFFLFYPRRPNVAYACWGAGIVLGLLMGFGQVMRGAHFFPITCGQVGGFGSANWLFIGGLAALFAARRGKYYGAVELSSFRLD